MEKKNTGLIVLVIILILIVLGLGGYLVYDKVLSKEEVKETEVDEVIETDDNVVSVTNKLDSFDEDIYYFYNHYLTQLSSFLHEFDNIDLSKYNAKDDETIKWYVFEYYLSYCQKYNLSKQVNLNLTYNVSKDELDKIVYMVFGKDGLADYTFTYRDSYGIKKISETEYQMVWYATAGANSYLNDSQFNYNNDIVEITSGIKYVDQGGEHYPNGKIKFTVKYSKEKGLYTITNVEKVEA